MRLARHRARMRDRTGKPLRMSKPQIIIIPIGGTGFNLQTLGQPPVTPCSQQAGVWGSWAVATPEQAQQHRAQRDAAWAARGSWKALTALAGADPCPPAVVAQRKALCDECEHGGRRKGWTAWLFGSCALCGCCTSLKATLAAESCPHNPPKWLAVTRDGQPVPVV